MTKSPPAAVVGNQRPRIELLPKSAFTDSGDDAVDLCRDVAGFYLDDWQEYVLRSMLGERLDYKWSASTVGLIVPRQQGKSAILEARCLAGLFLFGERILYTAKVLDTANDIYDRILGWIRASPDLDKQVSKVLQNNNGSKIELESGARLEIGARTEHQGRGKTFDCVIFDEAYGLEQKHLSALQFTTSASPNEQAIWASSAGMPESVDLAKLRERGMDKTSKSLAYFEWSAPDDADPDDLEALIQANPGLGIRLSMESVASQRGALDDEEFKRERLGIWAKVGGEQVIPAADWSDCLDTDSQPGEFHAFALDVPWSRDSANVAVVSARPDGRLHAEIIERRNGTSWVPEYLRNLQQAQGNKGTPIFISAGSAASSLKDALALERVRIAELGGREVARACGQLFDDILNRKLVHRGQDELDEAIKVAQTKTSSIGLWYWVAPDRLADVSPLYAITLARAGWSMRGEKKLRAQERRQSGVAPSGRAGGGRRGGGRRAGGRQLSGQ